MKLLIKSSVLEDEKGQYLPNGIVSKRFVTYNKESNEAQMFMVTEQDACIIHIQDPIFQYNTFIMQGGKDACNVLIKDITSDVEKLDEKFDIIFTSYGTIGWLPDIKKWANIVSHFLKPEGEFIIAEFHPFIWMLDNNFENIKYPYFHTDEPIEETTSGTYADNNAKIEMIEYGWNHSISDLINSLINEGMEIKSFNEFSYSPYNCFPNMEERQPGRYVWGNSGVRIPHVFSLKMQMGTR